MRRNVQPHKGQARLRILLFLSAFFLWFSQAPALAQDSARLLATSGVSEIEGAAGGGLVPWAVIAGYGTRDAVGGALHATGVAVPDFNLGSVGAALGLYDRLELSYAHAWFDTGGAGGRLGLGRGYQFHLDVAGVKLRLLGDAVWDQDSWLPQIAAGAQLKSADSHSVLRAIGASSPVGADYYVSATKLLLAQSLLLNATVRATKANQFGLLGFGGDQDRGYSAALEGSAALLLSRNFAVGAEIRTKPDNLRFAREGPAFDAFAGWFLGKHLSATLAVLALGPVARQGNQTGLYLSLQTGF
jgi:hypothetical protein